MSHSSFKTLSRLCLFCLILTLQGCAAVALTAGGLAAGVGIEHALSGIVYKTFSAPTDNVQVATLQTLKRMDIQVIDSEKTADGWEINATASNRDIDIELEALTPRTTRMRVVASKNQFFLRDSATATEIISQTAETMDQLDQHRG